MKKNILIGTHHKTGSVWIGGVFQLFAKLLDVEFHNISRSRIDEEHKHRILKDVVSTDNKGIFFDHHSEFPEIPHDMRSEFRGIHLIRNPRDILVSGALYHAWSDEKWLHVKRDKFGGLSYQEKMNSYGNLKDKLKFEMNNSSKNTIKNMAKFDVGDIFLNVKFEVLMKDKEFCELMKIAKFLELEGEEIIFLLTAFFNKSLFGKGSTKKTKHVQSVENKREYRRIVDTELADDFNLEFELDQLKLGYD